MDKKILLWLYPIKKEIMRKILLFCLLIVSCGGEFDTDLKIESRKVLGYFLDSLVSKATHGDNYTIAPYFDNSLTESNFEELISDTILTKQNIDFMFMQYSNMNQVTLKELIDKEYHKKIAATDTIKGGEVQYYMSPVLFTMDMKHSIIYSKTFFLVNEKIRWDELYFIFKREKDKWIIDGIITPDSRSD